MMAALAILAVILVLLGAAGTVFSVIPAMPTMLAGAWLLAYAGHYQIIGSWSLTAVVVVAVLGFVMDSLASFLGAKYTGASKQALWGAVIGGVVGIFMGLFGLLFAPLIGAAVGEFLAKKDLWLASKVGLGTFIGFIVGTVAKIGAALTIILILLWQYGAYWFQAA